MRKTTYLLSNYHPHPNTAFKITTSMSYFTYSGGIFLFMDAVIDFVASSKCVLAKARAFLRLTPNICDATIFHVLKKFAGNFLT